MRQVKQEVKGNNNKVEYNEIVVSAEFIDQVISNRYPSLIGPVVQTLFEHIRENQAIPQRVGVYEPGEKIEHNNVVKYKALISAWGEFTYFLDKAYATLDSEVPGNKQMIMLYINTLYLESSGIYLMQNRGVDKMTVIRENADQILDDVMKKVFMTVLGDEDDLPGISKEELLICIRTIACHAFVECKILEHPDTK